MKIRNTDALWPKQWQQLAVMLDAGLTIEQSLKILKGASNQLDQELSVVIRLIQRGIALSDALLRAKVLNKSDYAHLNISEKSGKLPLGLSFIAERRLKWHQRVKTLQGALWLPKCLLIIGVFAGVFVRTASSKQPLGEALWDVSIILSFAWIAVAFSVWLIQRDVSLWLSLGWRITWLRNKYAVYKLSFEHTFYRLLIWQLASGVAPDVALKNSQSLLSVPSYKLSLKSIAHGVASGQNLPQCLIEHRLVLTQPLLRVLKTSTQSGTWEEGVSHHLDWQQQVLARKADDFFKWLPRAYYLFALLIVSKFMFV